MQRLSLLLLRTGLAVTFLWVGVLILGDITTWAHPILPWAKRLLTIGGSLKPVMQLTAALDLLIGLALVLNMGTWIAALVGAVMLLAALIVTGASGTVAANAGLLGAALAVFLLTAPEGVLEKMKFL